MAKNKGATKDQAKGKDKAKAPVAAAKPAKPAAKPAPAKAVAAPAAKKEAPKAKATAPAKPAAKPETRPVAKAEAKPAAKVEAKPAAKAEAKPAAKAVAKAEPAKPAAAKATAKADAKATAGKPATDRIEKSGAKPATDRVEKSGAKPATDRVEKPAAKAPKPESKASMRAAAEEKARADRAEERARNANLRSPFSGSELKEWRDALIQRRMEISNDIAGLVKDAMEAEDGHTTPNHIAERGSDADLQDMSLSMAGDEEAILWQIDRALQKIEKGAPIPFGLCEYTKAPIAKSRLQLIPWTPLSIEGATHMEQNGLQLEDLLVDD